MDSLEQTSEQAVDNDYAQEIKELTEALALMPYDAVLYTSRGWAYYYSGINEKNLNAALKDFNKAIKIDVDCEPAYFGRATIYCTIGDYRRAIKDFDKVVALDPDYPDTYSCRGGAHIVLKNYAQAIEDFTKAIELGLNDADTYNLRGHCYEQLGNDAKAKADFDMAKQLGDNE